MTSRMSTAFVTSSAVTNGTAQAAVTVLESNERSRLKFLSVIQLMAGILILIIHFCIMGLIQGNLPVTWCGSLFILTGLLGLYAMKPIALATYGRVLLYVLMVLCFVDSLLAVFATFATFTPLGLTADGDIGIILNVLIVGLAMIEFGAACGIFVACWRIVRHYRTFLLRTRVVFTPAGAVVCLPNGGGIIEGRSAQSASYEDLEHARVDCRQFSQTAPEPSRLVVDLPENGFVNRSPFVPGTPPPPYEEINKTSQ